MVLVTAFCTVLLTLLHSSSGILSVKSNTLKSIHDFQCMIIRDLILLIPEGPRSFPYFLQFKPEFCNKNSRSEPQSIPSFVSTDSVEILHLWLQKKKNNNNNNQSDFGIDQNALYAWWCPCIESSLGFLARVFAMTSLVSWQNSVSLCPASLLQGQTGLIVQVSLDFIHLQSNILWLKKHLSFNISSRKCYRSS